MKNYAIVTESGCDLSAELMQEFDIDYAPMHSIYDDKDTESHPDWRGLSPKEFYDMMRGGKRIRSAAVSVDSYLEVFEKYLSQGTDVLCLSTTSVLSRSVVSARMAIDELKEKYPESKIVCIDTARACGALGLLCLKASKLREEGKTIEEVAAWVEANKQTVNQEGTVEKLTWLKQAGRVSFMSAFFGDLLGIKPLILADVHGYNVAVEKVKGRKASLAKVAERVAKSYLPNDLGVLILHADCENDALALRKEIMARTGLKEEDFRLGYIGTAIGASVGPGMVGVYFFGKEVTLDSLAAKK